MASTNTLSTHQVLRQAANQHMDAYLLKLQENQRKMHEAQRKTDELAKAKSDLNLDGAEMALEQNYYQALAKVSKLLEQEKPETNAHLFALITQIQHLKDEKQPLPILTKALDDTYSRLTGTMSAENYEKSAQKMVGHVNPAMKVLGALMIAIAFAATILTAIYFPPVMTGLQTLGFGGCLTGSAGVMFFGLMEAGKEQSNASKMMSQLNHTAPKEVQQEALVPHSQTAVPAV